MLTLIGVMKNHTLRGHELRIDRCLGNMVDVIRERLRRDTQEDCQPLGRSEARLLQPCGGGFRRVSASDGCLSRVGQKCV